MASKNSFAAVIPEISQPPAPLLVDIRTAARLLGISVFAVRNLCWHRETARLLKPVRQGLKFLFSPVAVADFTQKLVNGEVQFPSTPSKPKSRKCA
jgi:hypothetical protein